MSTVTWTRDPRLHMWLTEFGDSLLFRPPFFYVHCPVYRSSHFGAIPYFGSGSFLIRFTLSQPYLLGGYNIPGLLPHTEPLYLLVSITLSIHRYYSKLHSERVNTPQCRI